MGRKRPPRSDAFSRLSASLQVLLRDEARKRGKPEAYVKEATARKWMSWVLTKPDEIERRVGYAIASRCHPGNTKQFLWGLAEKIHGSEAERWVTENRVLLAEHLLVGRIS